MELECVNILQFLTLNHYFSAAQSTLCCCLDFKEPCKLHIFVGTIDAF